MGNLRVIGAQGATLRGPARLRLSVAQWSLRSHVLGPFRKGKAAFLDGDKEITLKFGEVFGMEEWEGRLSAALFEDMDKVKAEEGAPATAGSGESP